MAHDLKNCVCDPRKDIELAKCELCECEVKLETVVMCDVDICRRCWKDRCDDISKKALADVHFSTTECEFTQDVF